MQNIIVVSLADEVSPCTNAIVAEVSPSPIFEALLTTYAKLWEELAWEERCNNHCYEEEELNRLYLVMDAIEKAILAWDKEVTICNGFISWPGGYMYCSC
jgi:hypothetical protein